jgi:hypothetical protein
MLKRDTENPAKTKLEAQEKFIAEYEVTFHEDAMVQLLCTFCRMAHHSIYTLPE